MKEKKEKDAAAIWARYLVHQKPFCFQNKNPLTKTKPLNDWISLAVLLRFLNLLMVLQKIIPI
ncbi:hypothetical protein LPBF_02790 [Flavobacterium crassostreae]|uniref:Uncharacterized protein n=1 Tax=Flavobacterium crassostreae TaxID=1763534 RepID=A0A1B9E7H0_9FLAO|nr:hypothetical protein LPBF_02790 [Flavobacterium crassostreae]